VLGLARFSACSEAPREMHPPQITQLLEAWGSGDRRALDDLLPLVEGQLRRLAGRHLARERRGHTLQPTALVNEAFLRLVQTPAVSFRDRAHFFAVAARIMRHVLVDHSRASLARKRGGANLRVPLEAAGDVPDGRPAELLAVDEALSSLARQGERLATVAELRIFGGMSIDETSEVLGVSTATVSRDWRLARAWLARELSA
jgi:RNA polymerase sigma-70 factor, ECF subfamily